MVFITTGQRIATENFADGVIYKVTFVDTTISYMMCVGIGQDFVMLQGPNPSLFCLTMSSASRVSTIDIHDPTPPEPPTPIENALQYQTGEPPFTFTTTESSLFSWYIEGPCGVKTANLFSSIWGQGTISASTGVNVQSSSEVRTVDYIAVEYNKIYSISRDITSGQIKLRFYASDDSYIGTGTGNIEVIEGQTASNPMATNDSFCCIKIINSNISKMRMCDNANNVATKYMMIEGQYTAETMPSYEPYGKYKISILSNDNAETIYLDEALAEGERLYSVNIDTVVLTDIGENIISVTPTPPEMQIVYGIYAEA